MGHFSSERWSIVTTVVSGGISLFVIGLICLKIITGEAFNFLDEVSVDYIVLGVAMLHIIYTFLITPFALKQVPIVSGIINTLLLAAVIGLFFFSNQSLGPALYSLWLSVILLAGLYHWTLALLAGSGGIATLLLVSSESATAPSTTVFILCLLSLLTTFGSIILWAAIKHGRKKVNHALSSSALQTLELESLIDSIGDGVAVINKEGQIEVFNPAAATITGWSENEALGLDHRSVFAMLDKTEQPYEDVTNPIIQALQTEQAVVDNSGFLRTQSKNNIDVDLLASPIKTEEQGLVGAVVIFRDVSKARNEERQRAEFISTASHEMRTPVASIEGYLALALNNRVSKIDDSARSYLEKAHKSTKHLGRLFQDLLTAAKSEDGRLTNHPVVVDMGEMLDEMTHDMLFSAQEHGLTLKANLGGGTQTVVNGDTSASLRPVAYVHVDPERIREVITNLYDNAVKYTEEGSITINMSITEDAVKVSVADTGIGISREDLPHLFQKFYRIDNTDTRQVGGTGLGLFICKKILDMYKGKIGVESELGQGSTFTISLPRLSAEEARKMKMMEANQINPVSQEPEDTKPPLPKIDFKTPEPAQEQTSPQKTAPTETRETAEELKPEPQSAQPPKQPQSIEQPKQSAQEPAQPNQAAPQPKSARTTQTTQRPVHIDNTLPAKRPQPSRPTVQTKPSSTKSSQPRAMATYVKVRSHPDRPPRAKIYMPKSSQAQTNEPIKSTTSVTKTDDA